MSVHHNRALPGFGLTLGCSVFYLSLMVILPLLMIPINTGSMGLTEFWSAISSPRVLAAYRVSFSTAFFAAVANSLFGLLVAWVLVRYHFPGRKIIDALIDLPFALPTAVAGIALTSLYSSNGWIGSILALYDIKIAYTQLGIFIALTFIGIPFVVRTVQPVLADFEPELEEAAATIGASSWYTFRRIIFPSLRPALLSGFSLAFARSLGEYGSVVFISGNMPLKTEIVPLLIMTRLEQFDYKGATALAFVMLGTSFILMLVVNLIETRLREINS